VATFRPSPKSVHSPVGLAVSSSGSIFEALELFVDRRMAELMVENWDRDEPDRAGELYVAPVELETFPY
jgi:hypothetical protein